MSATEVDFLPAEDRAGRPIIRPRIHHFGMATTRFEEMLTWYRDVLGLEVVARVSNPIPNMAFVTSDEHHHRGGFFGPPQLKDNPDRLEYSRIQHLAWEYEDIDQLLESWDRIKNLGIEPRSCWAHGGNGISFAFYYKDPDNNTVELTTQGYEDLREGLAGARSPEFAKNPNGTAVDPAKLREARANGVSLNELRARAVAGEYRPEVDPHPLSTW
jgi:catechol 2,3-dioxygenase-like lactoylglutathione lyase family enzyme